MPGPLDGLLRCKSCQQNFDLISRRPKFLVCHHCFCMQCIQSLITAKVNQTVPCPTCNKITCIARNGVAALPDNEYLLPQLEATTSAKDDIFCSDSEGEGDDFGGEEASGPFHSYTNGHAEIPQPRMAVKIFCQTCLKIAAPSCLSQHQISNYEQGINTLQMRLKNALDQAGEHLSNEVQFLEENLKYLERVQNSWATFGEHLHESIIANTMSLTSAKSLLDKLPENSLGLPMAKAGDPTVLARVTLDTEQTMSNSANRLFGTKTVTNIWRALSSCNVNIHTPSTNLPPNCMTFPVELQDHTKDDLMCLLFALSKIIEGKIKQEDQPNKENDEPKKESDKKDQRSSEFQVVTANKKITKPISSGVVCCYFDLVQGNVNLGRLVFEINCKAAPRMAKNFIELCTGEHGFGFLNTKLWKTNFGDHVDGGDLPEGGDCSIYDRKPFYGDASNLPDGLGMLRMRGRGTSQTGQPIVGSQFMVWIKERSFKNYSRTLVFGRVKSGIELIIDMPESKQRKGKTFTPPVSIANCGILK